ncbi:MAG: hypothetical protein AMXMBFR13_30880 [Phycisphaerae bacterium]
MIQVLKQTVQIQPGGRVEVVSSELPDGELAEVIVLIHNTDATLPACLGLFAEEPELMDQVVADAMASRGQPLRYGDAQSPAGH